MNKILKIEDGFAYIGMQDGTFKKYPISAFTYYPSKGDSVKIFVDEHDDVVITEDEANNNPYRDNQFLDREVEENKSKLNEALQTDNSVIDAYNQRAEHVNAGNPTIFAEPEKPILNQQPSQSSYANSSSSLNFDVQHVAKSKVVAGILAILLGTLGIHNFYLGKTSRGVIQLLLSTIGWLIIIGPIIAGIWALVEGILILTSVQGSPWHKDGKGYELQD